MTPERWEKVQELFYGAELVAPGERTQWLQRVCPDVELRREVANLLGSADTTAPLIEESILSTASEMLTVETLGPGGRLGPYEIVRTLGQGGMGVVFLARRADQQFKQQVAIKLIQAWLGDHELILRFRAERQILAQLSHPNVAKLLDGGVSPAGQPYLVMEYVDGPRLDQYCERRQLGLRERLLLFRQICAGVQAAHQSLIVHRDLKPANILVASDGVPKLLDFGIAKMLSPDALGATTVAVTRNTERLMTVEYASPEQVRGDAVTTATDIYSLGVLLYELLTGTRPFERGPRSNSELERRVLEEEPTKPSTAAGRQAATARLPHHQALEGDLDNIILKAIQKDPARRYASVGEFSEDIRRYLEGFPVLARPDSWTYRSGKFIRRHRWGVAVVSVFVVTVVSALIGLITFARRATVERDRAEQVSEFLINLIRSSDPENAQGRDVTTRELLDKGVEQARKGKLHPEVREKLLRTFGLVYESLGTYDRSRKLLEEGLVLARENHGPRSLEVADLQKAIAELARRFSDFAAAESLSRESLAIRRSQLGPRHPLTAESLNTLALTLHEKGDYRRAEPLFLELLAMRDVLSPQGHLETALLSNLGGLYHDLGEFDKSERFLRECIELRRQQLGDSHPRLALVLTKLGATLLSVERWKEAEEAYAEGLRVYQKVYKSAHPDINRAMTGVARARLRQGQFRAAEALLQEVAANPVAHLDRDQIFVFAQGELAEAQGDWPAALRYYNQVAAHREKVLGPEHLLTGRARFGQARVLWALGQKADALATANAIARWYGARLGPHSPEKRQFDRLLREAELARLP
jgi:serine/threonine-protein kinase